MGDTDSKEVEGNLESPAALRTLRCLVILLEVLGPLTFIFWLSFVLPSVAAYLIFQIGQHHKTIGFVLPSVAAYQQLPAVLGFLTVMNLLVGFGNSYNRAEAILFSNEARLDLVLARPVDVVQSAVIITYLDNLRPGMHRRCCIGSTGDGIN